ncbi:heme biosynthesis protein HemY [Bartonella bacilliformis]|uniref:heme biosynthesis protein HemY n=1 Tax=Bartonella bacilliformis TaxID=774 RepID=UPI00049F7C1B|nr:heme biosynthesis HemY N-terminal domain-containing protein [Bartonella bacilliformis]KEG18022.1 hypothetical protein H705_00062 [Bartonella bacilliformis Cond044]
MIRVVVYSFAVCVLGALFGWVANHNSIVVITFLQTRFAISLLTLLSVSIVLLVMLALVWWLLRGLFFAPNALRRYFSTRRQKKGREALSQGLLAVFSGDYVTAKKMETCALKYLANNHEPLMKLLQAQTLFLQKDSIRAIGFYEEMRQETPTKLAGLYGLYREAVAMKEDEAAQHYAEEALALSPALLWAHQAVIDRLSAEGQWDKALDVFEKAQKALPRADRWTAERNYTYALLLSGQALQLFKTHPVKARTAILKAHKLLPDFVPITVITADILYKSNEVRKADKIIFNAWKKEPHPDLGACYLKNEERAVERLKKAKKLASYNEDTFESAFLVAKAALDAGEVEFAREQAQKALQLHPRESVYLLLADIEEAQGNDQLLVRQWLSLALRAERDPTWMCDGTLFSSWSAVSPISGRLGCFEWKAPPRSLPLTLEIDPIEPKDVGDVGPMVLKNVDPVIAEKEEKEDVVTEITFVNDELLNEISPIKDGFLPQNSAKKKISNQTRLNVDDPGVKIAERDILSSKEQFRAL